MFQKSGTIFWPVGAINAYSHPRCIILRVVIVSVMRIVKGNSAHSIVRMLSASYKVRLMSFGGGVVEYARGAGSPAERLQYKSYGAVAMARLEYNECR